MYTISQPKLTTIKGVAKCDILRATETGNSLNMIIDECYEGVVAKLTKEGRIMDISQKLLSLQINHERVLYVYELLENLTAFPSVLKIEKNEIVSTYYRNHGNKCYQAMKNYEAWQYYNLALLHAPVKSNSYCLALSNRSAVFLSLKEYEECLADVETILNLECSIPEDLKTKLEKRKNECLQSQSHKNKVSHSGPLDLIELKGTRSDRYPSASTKLQVVYSKDMGRHVIAKEDLKVGEVLVEEDPYFTLVLKSQMLFCCSHCLARNLNLTPCEYCCFTFYCSKQCQQNAWKDYHAVECPLMATLIDMDFTKLELLALRTVIKARNDYPNWTTLFQTIKEAEANINTEYHGHIKVNDQWVYDSKYYPSIHTLESNIDKRSISDIFQKAVTAAVFLKLISDSSDFLKGETDEENEKIKNCVAGMLLHHDMTSPTNMHGISSNTKGGDGNFVEEVSIASAPYAFHSLLNHSCAPNVVRFSLLGSGRKKLFVLRPIKKGMQLFDNYGSHYAIQDRYSRQSSLKFQYKFICQCEACVNNWPMYLTMRPSTTIPLQIAKLKKKVLSESSINNLQVGDFKAAKTIYPLVCSLCEKLAPYAPCMELCDCEEALKQCIVIFQGVVPNGHTELIKWSVKPPKDLK